MFFSSDICKAFDIINHYAVFTTLMKGKIPHELLNLLEHLLTSQVHVYGRELLTLNSSTC